MSEGLGELLFLLVVIALFSLPKLLGKLKGIVDRLPAPKKIGKKVEEWIESAETTMQTRQVEPDKRISRVAPATVLETEPTEPPPLKPETAAFAEETPAPERGIKGFSIHDISLRSPADLKRGIILSEILGPCRARRKTPRTR